jgi:hypothetical protein
VKSILVRKYHLNISLPDHFSRHMNLTPVDDPDENLRALAKRHEVLSGSYANWPATYRHAGQVGRSRKIPARQPRGSHGGV